MNKKRMYYAIAFVLILMLEILIALFVRDRWIRPYVGDALVTVLLCCLARAVLPQSVPGLPVWVFLFASVVELAQLFDVVKVLGLENNRFLSTLLGRTFSFMDLLCYGAGCAVFFTVETLLRKNREVEI